MKDRAPSTITPFLILALAAAVALAPRAAAAETPDGAAYFSTSFASRYVWRGQTLSEGFVVQPTIGIERGGFAANLWSSVDLDIPEENDDNVNMNETDLTLSYTLPVGPVSITGGFVHFDYDGGDTQELFLTCALATLLNPELTLSYDIDEGDGGFALLAVSQEIPAGPVTLAAGASLGINLKNKALGQDAGGKDFTGLYCGEISLATSIPLGAGLTLDPRVAYSGALGDDAKAAIAAASVEGKKSVLYGSVALTLAF